MDFSVSRTMQDTLARVRRLVDDHVIPVELDVLSMPWAEAAPVLDAVRGQVKEAGLWAPQLPGDIGGMGLSNLEHGLMSAELGRSPIGHYCFGCQAPDAGNLEILHSHGNAEQKRDYLEPLASGSVRSCFSMTEPDNAGSNPTVLSTRAVRDGDDYVINGRKWFTTGADGAAFAIVMAVTNPDQPPHLRASQIIVPTNNPGFHLVRNIPVMGHAGGGWASHAEIEYRDCRVPVTNRIGAEGAGFAMAQERLGPGRIHHCMRWIGICERAFELMCRRAATRAVGQDRVLGSHQIIQSWIAEARAEIDAARLMVLQAAWTIDAHGMRAARNSISLIKFHVAGVMQRTVDRAIQVHGALGTTSDTVLSWFYAHERGARIYDGPDEVHKMVVARRIMKDYGLES